MELKQTEHTTAETVEQEEATTVVEEAPTHEEASSDVSATDPDRPEGAEPARDEASPEGEHADVEALRAEAAQLREEVERLREQLRRQAAEFQNYRRRTAQEKAVLVETGKGMMVEALLEVIDDFERSREAAAALEGADEASRVAAFEALKEGIGLVYTKLTETLARHGVEPIEAVGRPFDEARHEAILQQPAPEGTPPGQVLQEVQKGYKMGDRVLRHARVIVAGE